MNEPAIVVVEQCRFGHESAYVVEGVSFDDPHMGTKVLDLGRQCMWPGCESKEFVRSSIYKSEIVRV